MAAEASTLAIASAMHLAGAGGGSKPFSGSGAGIAEAIICLVLAAGAAALLRKGSRALKTALAATCFAVFGFVVGLTFTLRGGDTPDVVYHATMLPVPILTATALCRARAQRTR
jgi:hypothetical protein